MTDNVVSGMSNVFKFKVIVKNDPPEFDEKLQDQRIRVGTITMYVLPKVKDREKLMYTVKAKFQGNELP
jgi:hypothetical protein